MRTAIAAVLLLMVSVSRDAHAADEAQITALYRRAVAGDKPAVEKCIAALESAVRDEPQNQIARVYLGSAYTLRSRDMGIGPGKIGALRQGLATMDAAVAAAPDNTKVRLVRAITTDALPFFLGRKKAARDDFEFLARELKRNPEKFSGEDARTIAEHQPALDTANAPR